MEENKKQSCFDKVEAALNAFWLDHGAQPAIKARHTEVSIEPRFFVGDRLNPQIAKKIVEVFLLNATPAHFISGRITVTKEGVQIKDARGAVIVEAKSPAFIKLVRDKKLNS